MLNKDKKNFRTQMRKRRAQVSLEEQQKSARQLTKIVSKLPDFMFSQRIAAYWPNDNEISPLLLLEKAHSMGKQCYLPVLHPIKSPKLIFTPYNPGDPLKKNRYGIPEPRHTSKTAIIPPWTLDLVLVPLVAFDNQGTRLGMGKGYYDNTFAFLKPGRVEKDNRKVTLIGLAYEFQNLEDLALPTDEWDIPLAGIATEKRYIEIIKGKKGQLK